MGHAGICKRDAKDIEGYIRDIKENDYRKDPKEAKRVPNVKRRKRTKNESAEGPPGHQIPIMTAIYSTSWPRGHLVQAIPPGQEVL